MKTALSDENHANGPADSPAEACLRRRPEVRSQNSRVGAAAGAAGGGLNCANFGIIPVKLCN